MSNIEETDDGITDLPTDTTDFGVTDTETGWDEGEEEEDEEEAEEEETDIEGPVHFNTNDFISSYHMIDNCTVPENILEFDHSYGYDCKRYFNLVVADENTIMFASGNLIHFLDVTSRKVSFRRSALGGGIGSMVKNPNPEYPHIAIAENGKDPPVIIYEWPTLEIVSILRGGAAACFTNLSYSPDGLLLVTQAGEPDNLITIWNWRKSRIMLRTLSSTNDVYRAIFSPSVPGHLTTCGLAHIKFWKMAKTFTGLKLKGELGRFGKTEYTDILGIYPMPDEKVISGCVWGNILIWDEGLIKLEVFRKLRKKCHEKAIVQFDYKNGELWTISQDGHIKVWYYDTIDQADPPDEDRVVQMEPSYDFYTPNTELMYVKKQNYIDDDENTMYFAQDGNGGIWCLDLNTEDDPLPPIQLLKCHAGPVADIAACPWGSLLCSFGKDGRLYIYNYLLKIMVYSREFSAGGRCIIWLSMNVDPTGDVILLAFEDGIVRVAVLEVLADAELELILIQVTKPHKKAITAMSINSDGSLLVTGGEDATIFVFMVKYTPGNFVKLIPIGYVPTPDGVSCLTWHNENDAIVIVGCIHGQIMQVKVPTKPVEYTKITYILNLEPKYQKFITYKAQIRRDIKIAEINGRKKIKRDKKRVEMEKIMKDNPGLDIDEEVFLADSDSEEELEPLYIPPVPNRILWIQHLLNNNLWLSMAGYDAGYIYQYHIDQKDNIPLWFKMVKNADDTEISSYLYNHSMTYLILAMQDGRIRVNKCDFEDVTDLTDYWIMSMHDNYNGFVPRMCFSFDEKYFFTCGHDGNVFSYRFNIPEEEYIEPHTRRLPTEEPSTAVNDITDPKYLSLEEAIVKKEEDRKFKVAEDHKTGIRKQLQELRKAYTAVLEKNKRLLKTQIIPRENLEIDERIAGNLRYHLSSHLALVKRKLAFQVEKSELGIIKMKGQFTDPLDVFPIHVTGIRRPTELRTMRQRKLGKEFYELLELVEQKIIEAEIRGRYSKRLIKAFW